MTAEERAARLLIAGPKYRETYRKLIVKVRATDPKIADDMEAALKLADDHDAQS